LDRRAYPRFAVSCPVDFSLDLLGSQFLVAQFSTGGTVLDISRNGLLAEVDRLAAVGTDCIASLIHADGLVWPHRIPGQVRRAAIGHAGWRVGVAFHELIDVLPQLAAEATAAEVHTAGS
jgi:hypothetical protein